MTKKEARILIVEDEAIIAENIKNRLTGSGYTAPVIVYTGKDAILFAKETQPDLILMDIKLNGDMDGIEAAREIRSRFDIPIVYLTAYADEETVERAKATTPFGYIIKPFTTSELLTAVEIALYKHKVEKKLQESEERYRIFFKAARDCAFITTKDGKWVDFSDITVDFFGYASKDELQKIPIPELYENPEERGNFTKLIEEFGHVEDYKADLRKKDGSIINALMTSTLIKDNNGNIIGFQGTIRDITLHKQEEEELKQTLEKLRKSLAGTIQAMSLTVEARDPSISGHQRRVSSIVRAIAQEMNLSKDLIDHIRTAGIIHDIGKMSVPAEILSKPGKLTDIEMRLIKCHPQTGYDILKDVGLPYPIAEMVLQHHERLDGSGYPQGLKNGQILLESQILAVADVVEAIASHRPYRPALGIDAALAEIEKNAGILYNRDVVEACLRLFRENGFSYEYGRDGVKEGGIRSG